MAISIRTGNNKEKNVSTPSEKQAEQMSRLKMIHSFRGGSEAMRTPEYLPIDIGETEEGWKARAARSIFINFYGRTIEKLSGEVFSTPVMLDDNGKKIKELNDFENDVDRQGNDLNRFCYNLFSKAVEDGISFLLVDYPCIETRQDENGVLYYLEKYEHIDKTIRPSEEWKQLNKRVEEEKRLRPYWSHILFENLLGGKFEIVNGRIEYTMVRIKEVVEEDDGEFHTREITQIRVLKRDSWAVYRLDEDQTKSTGKEVWVVYSQGRTTRNFIPLVPIFIGTKKTPFTSEIPLKPLADLNLTHFQSMSDQRNILHFARLIVWFSKGLDVETDHTGKKTRIKWGGNRLVNSSKEYGDLKVVEHSGKSIESGFKDIDQLKSDMALFGLTFMMPKVSGGTTATQATLDKAENTSALSAWAVNFEASLNTALGYTKEWMDIENSEKTGKIVVHTEFKNVLSELSAQVLLKSVEIGKLPVEMFLDELKRRKFIDEKWTYLDVKRMLMSEQQSSVALDGLTGFMKEENGTGEEDTEDK